ncbi:FluG domain-containing protein [Diplogelasinospora grovesii]|uniref:FluG domain-containing protein n=1 Tax=Diplogelasinospora grovesii TaxID=303347 RepID=A0AAN6S082_9PEZI|nr:FluG domain-containing protein [Diplogelasinospora grovesii]
MVPDEVWQEMPPDPELEAPKRRRAELKAHQFRILGRDDENEIRDLSRQIRNKQGQRSKNVKITYRKYYFRNRPTWDIERQFSGEAEEADVEYVAPAIKLHIQERAELAEILVSAELMTALDYKREMAKRKRILQRAHADDFVKEKSPRPDPFPLLMRKTQCPRCIGDERQSYEERTFSCRPAHLKEIEERERNNLIFCDHPKCREDGVKLKHLDHFRNHVQTVHGISPRRKQSS